VTKRGARIWRFDLAQLTSAAGVLGEGGGSQEPALSHRVSRATLAPVSFEIEYRAPVYARLPVQRGHFLTRRPVGAARQSGARWW
jgi:hypothetical protein